MDTCSNCKSPRIAGLGGKCSDLCWFTDGKRERDGYVPQGVGISESGDYIDIDYCLDCGTIQGKFPITQKALNKAFDSEYQYATQDQPL